MPNEEFCCTTKLLCQYFAILVQSEFTEMRCCTSRSLSLFLTCFKKQRGPCNSCFLLISIMIALNCLAVTTIAAQISNFKRKIVRDNTFTFDWWNDATVPRALSHAGTMQSETLTTVMTVVFKGEQGGCCQFLNN